MLNRYIKWQLKTEMKRINWIIDLKKNDFEFNPDKDIEDKRETAKTEEEYQPRKTEEEYQPRKKPESQKGTDRMRKRQRVTW